MADPTTTFEKAIERKISIAGPGSKLKIVRLQLRESARSAVSVRSYTKKSEAKRGRLVSPPQPA